MAQSGKRPEGPDFIGIGMERAGTSWIFTMLAFHPQIWVPPLKELHYFDTIDPDCRQFMNKYHRHGLTRLKQKAAPLMRTEMQDRPELFKNSYGTYLRWDLDYFMGRYSHDWYRRLFAPRYKRGRIAGEITPAYSTLSEDMVRDLADNFPHVKIILSVRDPVSRTISGLIHYFRVQCRRDLEDVSEQEMLEWLDGPVASMRSDADRILKLWQNYIPQDRLHLISYEDIAAAPQNILQNLYGFLGADTDFQPPQEFMQRKVNAYTPKDIALPRSVRDKIAAL